MLEHVKVGDLYLRCIVWAWVSHLSRFFKPLGPLPLNGCPHRHVAMASNQEHRSQERRAGGLHGWLLKRTMECEMSLKLLPCLHQNDLKNSVDLFVSRYLLPLTANSMELR